ncbi:MAG: 2-C-methyl-D-erythritol 4-phosphate cytidylyltransferase [Puniceicoccales bacterium]|jgi:2-C-methyl-D-erythritol 4-phosphate cytidylyltransferase|nr:2-C-methyl-D-erythritol 4-phosphate cytidylyltransferase [Puniceicoccales bacterium]
MNSIAILLAGGSGNRMRGTVRDKILEPLDGIPVIAHSIRAFTQADVTRSFLILCRDAGQQEAIHAAIRPQMDATATVRWARGGPERQDSVLNGLEACPTGTELVFIHDTARPLVPAAALAQLAEVAARTGGAVLAHRVKDTIKQVPPATPAGTPAALTDLDRATLWAMETPQVFHHALILDAYRKVARENLRVTDDVAAAVHSGHKVALVENLLPNPKITEPHDLAWVAFLLKNHAANPPATKVTAGGPMRTRCQKRIR